MEKWSEVSTLRCLDGDGRTFFQTNFETLGNKIKIISNFKGVNYNLFLKIRCLYLLILFICVHPFLFIWFVGSLFNWCGTMGWMVPCIQERKKKRMNGVTHETSYAENIPKPCHLLKCITFWFLRVSGGWLTYYPTPLIYLLICPVEWNVL